MARRIVSEAKIFMKCIDKGTFGYFIGNCNLALGLRNVRIRFIPPTDEYSDDAEISIMSATYSDEEFEEFVADGDNIQAYFVGECNMDITAQNTVFKFFPSQTRGEWQKKDILIINQTQRRNSEDGVINNPLEVKVFMHQKRVAAAKKSA
jgi:hypothetical protein